MKMSTDLANAIVDHSAYAHWERSHEAFRELRANAPLAIAEPDDYEPFWAVTRFDDIQTVEKQGDLFHSVEKPTTLINKTAQKLYQEREGGVGFRTLVHMDNPDHFKHRILTQAWFMPQSLKKLEGRLREIAREFAERMLSFDGECDFAKDVAFLYPLRVVMEVIGVPPEDEARMLKLTQEMFGSNDPEMNRSGSDISEAQRIEDARKVVADFFNYFSALGDDRRANPREDLASVIANAEIDGERIALLDEIGYYIIAATAGHDTTSATTASAGWVLAENPEFLDSLHADMSQLPNFVEESIRWETPVKHFMRTAMEDTEVAGQKIARNDWLMLCYPSGNRDESKWQDPYGFDMTRFPNKHIAFGFGQHVCLGQHLARLEMRLLWEELLPKLKSIELTGEPTRMIGNFVCGPKSVPVRFEKA